MPPDSCIALPRQAVDRHASQQHGLALAPQVAVPAEPIDGLTAEAAGAGLGAMDRLAERGRSYPTVPLLTAF